MWLCRPDLPDNPCAADLSATEIHPDGSRTIVPFAPAPDAGVDCFYVYPAVDLDPRPGNHTDFVDRAAMRRVTLAQAGRFQEACRLYVPLYRQIIQNVYRWCRPSVLPRVRQSARPAAGARGFW